MPPTLGPVPHRSSRDQTIRDQSGVRLLPGGDMDGCDGLGVSHRGNADHGRHSTPGASMEFVISGSSFSFCRAITHSHNNLSGHKAALVAAVLRRWQ